MNRQQQDLGRWATALGAKTDDEASAVLHALRARLSTAAVDVDVVKVRLSDLDSRDPFNRYLMTAERELGNAIDALGFMSGLFNRHERGND